MLYTRLQQILQAKWLIHADVIQSYIPIFLSFLSGQQINLADFKDDKKAYAVAVGMNTATKYELDNPNILENSVAVIPINGVITTWKSMDIENSIKMAQANPNIIAILFITSTPGGMVVYTDILSNTIKNSSIPTVSYVIGMDASAGMWMTSGASKIILSSPLDYIGSIGVMTGFTDFSKLLEKYGITSKELYARKSSRKNEFHRALMDTSKTEEEKVAGILDDLDFTNDYFHNAISENLGIPLASEVFSGAIYTAQKGIDLGLAHEINPSVEYALETAYNLGLQNKIKSIFNQNN
jgi:protease IV